MSRPKGWTHPLTPHQIAVAAYYCGGATRPLIASTFGLAEGTVSGYVKLAKHKVCGSTRATRFELADALEESLSR